MTPGKLRVRCATCKGGSFVLERVRERYIVSVKAGLSKIILPIWWCVIMSVVHELS